MNGELNIVILGLSITSSWGNGHATTFRSLVKELDKLGHKVSFFERDKPWYASNRDMPNPPFGRTILYNSSIPITYARKVLAIIKASTKKARCLTVFLKNLL